MEAPDPSWTAKLRRTLSRTGEAVPRVAQVDVGGAAIVLTSHEIYKDRIEVPACLLRLSSNGNFQREYQALHAHTLALRKSQSQLLRCSFKLL